MEHLTVVGFSTCRTRVLLAPDADDEAMYWVDAADLVRLVARLGLLGRRTPSGRSARPGPAPDTVIDLRQPDGVGPAGALAAGRATPEGELDDLLDAWAGFVHRQGA